MMIRKSNVEICESVDFVGLVNVPPRKFRRVSMRLGVIGFRHKHGVRAAADKARQVAKAAWVQSRKCVDEMSAMLARVMYGSFLRVARTMDREYIWQRTCVDGRFAEVYCRERRTMVRIRYCDILNLTPAYVSACAAAYVSACAARAALRCIAC